MRSDYKSASDLIEGKTWHDALAIFLTRRQKLSEFMGAENEEAFLTDGSFKEIAREPSREPSVRRKLSDGRATTYALPDQTGVQIHKKGCGKIKIQGLRDEPSFYNYVGEPSAETLEFVCELENTEGIAEVVSTHGGFWLAVLAAISEEKIWAQGAKIPLIFGTYEFFYFNESIYKRLGKAGISAAEVTARFIGNLPKCPCFGFEKCIFCSQIFIPTSWAYVDLKVGHRVCALCAQLASDGRQALPWLEMTKQDISNEIDFGLGLQKNLQKEGTLNFQEAPQYDSRVAFRKLRLHALSDEDFVKGFLTVALRPKESQVRLVHGYWEQWLRALAGESNNSTTGLDGHSCNSLGEKTICDFLFRNDIEHKREPKYSDFTGGEWEASVRHFKGDFEVNGVIYEFAGMASNADYDQAMHVKLSKAQQLGIPVVVIAPSDLGRLHEIFRASDWP